MHVGLPGHGKSLISAKKLRWILFRNWRWYKKTGKIRKIYSNLKLSPVWEKRYPGFLEYYWDPIQLVHLEDVDIFIDEVARYFDARDWEKLLPEVKTFLQEHDKVGINIYANTQVPLSVDVAFRRLCENIFCVTKIVGSRRPSPTRLPVKIIWGFVWIRRIKRASFHKEIQDAQFETELFSIPRIAWIGRSACALYDTRQKIRPGAIQPWKHIEKPCEKPGCTTHKHVVHI